MKDLSFIFEYSQFLFLVFNYLLTYNDALQPGRDSSADEHSLGKIICFKGSWIKTRCTPGFFKCDLFVFCNLGLTLNLQNIVGASLLKQSLVSEESCSNLPLRERECSPIKLAL